MGRQRTWTTTELHHASRLWKNGDSIEEMALKLKRGRESIKHQTQSRRDLFPRRKQPRGDIKEVVDIKLAITPYMHRLMKLEAKERGISFNMLVRETFRDRFVRKLWKPQVSTSTAKVKFSNGSPAR